MGKSRSRRCSSRRIIIICSEAKDCLSNCSLLCIVLVVLFVDVATLTTNSGKKTKQMQDNVINDLPEFSERALRGLPRLA